MIVTVKNIFVEFYLVLAEMAPYLLFGFLVAGILSVLISPEKVERHLGGNRFLSVLKAAIFGVPLPLCSCGVIPVAASLRRSGAGRGATTSFLLSTPQTGVDSILVTYSLLGPVFAVFRPLAALVTGLIGGSLVNWLDPDKGKPMTEPAAMSCSSESCSCEVGSSGSGGCADGCGTKPAGGRGAIYRMLHYGFVTLPSDIGRALVIGLLIAGVISAAVPEDFFAEYLHNPLLQIFIMMALGLPMYVCATASVPVAMALMMKGIVPGAALAFLMTGPATNAATVSTIYKTMGKRTAVIYLVTVSVLAVVFGLILNQLDVGAMNHAAHAHQHDAMGPGIVGHVSAVALLAVLAYALLRKPPRVEVKAEAGERTATIKITGMRCNQCSGAVQRALAGSEGVDQAAVDLERGLATVTGREFKVEELAEAIRQLGYEPTEVDGKPLATGPGDGKSDQA